MQTKQWLEREVRLGDMPLQCGAVLRDARIRYLQRGGPNAPKDNIVLLPNKLRAMIAFKLGVR